MADNFYSSQFLDEPITFLNNYPLYGNNLNTIKKYNENLINTSQLSSGNDLICMPTQLNESINLHGSSSLRYFGTQSYNMNIKSCNNNNNNNSGNLSIGKYTAQQYNNYMGINNNGRITSNIGLINNHYNQHQQYYQQQTINNYGYSNGGVSTCFNRNRYTPYQNRPYVVPLNVNNNSNIDNIAIQNYQQQQQQPRLLPSQQQQQYPTIYQNPQSTINFSQGLYDRSETSTGFNNNNNSSSSNNSSLNSSLNNGPSPPQLSSIKLSTSPFYCSTTNSSNNTNISNVGNIGNEICKNLDSSNQPITLQINNLDYSLEEANLRSFLLNQLKPITPVISLIFEGSSYAKVTVPDLYFAKQVVANLHRKKIGHKRMVVSYTRDSSLTEINTLRCQVAGLLKDVPYCTLPMYKFRELFQSRFKTSISVLDLYKMQDICTITPDKTEEKFISLNPDFINSIENNPECLQESVPYCTIHFQREQHKGWAEQDIEPLPNIFMTISELRNIAYPLLKNHTGDIPITSLVHCIAGELGLKICPNDNGVNLEHLICCVNGLQITTNNYGIKILSWLEPEMSIIGKDNNGLNNDIVLNNICNNNNNNNGNVGNRLYSKCGTTADPLYQISREVIELVKMSPKSTMKFNRFIPAYHNHFGKQCRVADYGYTKLIELFEALSYVVQIMGDGENRQITLTHRAQIRRFTTDLLRILRTQGNKSILLSQLPEIFAQTQNRNFDVTDYGVCSLVDILDGLANSNIVVMTTIQNGKDILISIPKRKQTSFEVEKTCVFAGEVVELFRNAPNYSILFQKFVRSYHYHFGYQCRLSDYGFLKLADLMESIQGIVEIEFTNDEDKKIYLTSKIARRVFAEQLEDLIRNVTTSSKTCMKLEDVLNLHKKKFGYQIQSQILGYTNIIEAIKNLPYVEVIETDELLWIICHNDDPVFRNRSYQACKIILENGKDWLALTDLINTFSINYNDTISENNILTMKHAIEFKVDNSGIKYVGLTCLMKFIINIIKLLEPKSMSLSEIKNILHISLGDCFEFGYPNLYTLICAYSDIFTCELGQTQEQSEIGLVKQGELVTYIINNNQSTRVQQQPVIINNTQLDGKNIITQNNFRQPLTSYNRQSLPIYNCNNNDINIQFQQQQQQHNSSFISNITIIPPGLQRKNLQINLNDQHNQQISSCNKENSFQNSFNSTAASIDTTISFGNLTNNLNGNTSFNNSLNGINENDDGISSIGNSGGVIGNGIKNNIIGKSNGFCNSTIDVSKLWDNHDINYFMDNIKYNENDDIFDLLKTPSVCPVYEPPKPDTPPSDVIPFWSDPVWTNIDNDEKLDNTDSLNIQMPELKTFTILPMLMSPHQLLKSDNINNNLFTFESPDKKIS